MKVKKKWKKYVHQIALACLLICCIATCVPRTVKAELQSDQRQSSNEWDFSYVNSSGKDALYKIKVSGNSPVYAFCYDVYGDNAYKNFGFISKSEFKISREYYCDGKFVEAVDLKTYGKDTNCKHYGAFYRAYDTFTVYPKQSYYRCLQDTMKGLINKYPEKYTYAPSCFFAELLNNEQIPEYIECVTGDDSEGGINNPILDSDIGCPIITRKITRDLSGVDSGNSGAGGSLHVGETQVGDNIYYDNGGLENGGNGFYTSFTWKNSTTTGFSLNKNKYAQTFLQVRIQNRSVIYSNLKHTKVKRKLDSYGENSLVYDSWAVSKKPLYFNLSSKTFLKKYLPKYYDEINSPVNLTNALFLGNKYAFQFRIICTDDLSVIPGSGGNSKWHCGRWTEVTVNCDVLEDDDPYQKTGDIDSNGDFVQKEDDTTTKIDDSSSGQADNMDDFKDSAENGTKKGLDTSGFGWDDFKNLINECKQVPGLINSIFSFLPDWVLAFIAIGFGIWIFVLIKRAIV